MKTKYFVSFVFLIFLTASQTKAQNIYPVTDSVTGVTLYYKIISAYNDYNAKCIEDNMSNIAKDKYSYLIKDPVENNQYQEWELVNNTKGVGCYYIRNHKTKRYMSAAHAEFIGNYLSMGNYFSKVDAVSLNFVPITGNQVLLKYTDGSSDCYLCAADSAKQPLAFSASGTANSIWAWTLVCINSSQTGIAKTVNSNKVYVYVDNRQIVVIGTDDYVIYDLQGRKMPAQGAKPSGTYLVKTKRKTFKVLI